MEQKFDKLEQKIGKLQRNEKNMTPQQREQYIMPLRKLKMEIIRTAESIMHDFIFGGCLIPKEDSAGINIFNKKARQIIDEDGTKTAKEARDVLFSSYDISKFLEKLLPIHYRIFYEAYGPVWLSHCKKTEDPEYPYWNDIIKMCWEKNLSVWVDRKKEESFMLMLPPTKKLLENQYVVMQMKRGD